MGLICAAFSIPTSCDAGYKYGVGSADLEGLVGDVPTSCDVGYKYDVGSADYI